MGYFNGEFNYADVYNDAQSQDDAFDVYEKGRKFLILRENWERGREGQTENTT